MFLKTLTLKGFKSFAEPTSMELEPGVTVIVGPNGSGKSNVVDAVAWVLGAQGPKVVRSHKMEDVIFAGTGKRSALGRAEVSLTIDNSSKILPIDLSEVTITRTLFRSGDSEYALNGVECRLLDIQELLSDSGVGRTQHVIVSQGQLDWVLNARPEDRRSIIEEAAGVLKYRKRREKAERRLESTESDLQRLGDLVGEVRRSIRPLEKQADAARRYDDLAKELHQLRLYLVGRELDSLEKAKVAIDSKTKDLRARDHELTSLLRNLDDDVVSYETNLDVIRNSDTSPVIGELSAIRERAMGLARIVEEKKISIEKAIEATQAKSQAARRAQDELNALSLQIEETRTEREIVSHNEQAAKLSLSKSEARVAEAERQFRISESDYQRWSARSEALSQAMAQARAKAGAEQLEGIDGVMGALADLVDIDEGWELAFEAAVGDVSGAVIVATLSGAKCSLEKLSEIADGGSIYLARSSDNSTVVVHNELPSNCSRLIDHVRVASSSANPDSVRACLESLLSNSAVVDGDWSRALEISLDNPGHCIVTLEGDRFHNGSYRVGAGTIGASKAALDYALAQQASASQVANQHQIELDKLRKINLELRSNYEQLAREVARLDEKCRLLDQRHEVLSREADNYQERFEFSQELDSEEESIGTAPPLLATERNEILDKLKKMVIDTVEKAETSLSGLSGLRNDLVRKQSSVAAKLDEVRKARHDSERALIGVREQLQKGEIELAENTMRSEMIIESLRRDLDCEPEIAITVQCPVLPNGVTAKQRERELDRELKLLGPINPLALEELTVLQERYEFLTTQIEDIKAARKDLTKVLRAIDAEIQSVFALAFEDVASNFTALFATLFPGGLGKLTLTDPSNLLDTGIEIEAKPPGKNVRKLSLLSGGERSLVAMAFLFAVFRSRPSPFYILDEVEAALDDVNLSRFLDLINEFRQEAQLIIVSHQKRTMEQADCLYGVSMASGGSSKVLSERLQKSA